VRRCADFGRTEPVAFNDENNHIHLLVNFPPKVTLAKLANSLRGVTSRRMRQEFPNLQPHYYRATKTLLGFVFHRIHRRRSAQCRTSVHRTAEPPGLIRTLLGP